MPSALLFVLLGVMWAVVLVPMWLRKHDEANESRSIDRFSRALRSLSSRQGRSGQDAQTDAADTVVVERGAVPARREVMMPGRPRGAQDVQVSVYGPPATARREPRRRARGPAARRRRLVAVLLVVAALVLAAGLLQRLPIWAAAVPAVLAVLVLVNGRRQAARRAEMERRRARRAVLSDAARVAAQHYAATGRGPAPEASFPEAAPREEPVVVEEELADDPSWHAIATTLPTYVTAPAATKVPRVIDRTTSAGGWGAAMVEQARRTRQVQPDEDSGMRVESFEIAVPRPPSPSEEFAAEYVDPRAGSAELDATDDEAALAALLDDPRTGVRGRTFRRAAG